MDIFVGSLPFKLKENQLRAIFEKYGQVNSVRIINDKITRQNKGFGFIEMPDIDQAKHAIKELNGSEVDGRKIVVNKSEKKEEDLKKESDTPKNSYRSKNNPKKANNKGRKFGYLSYD
jgi:RNA recognition motif-containing protein